MQDKLAIYNKELNLLYSELKEFAKVHSISVDELTENPHVTRLVQAFTVLYTHLNLTLEESFTGFISSLFDMIYPHYNSPIPSIAVIELLPDRKHDSIVSLPKGNLIEMKAEQNCFFQVCYDTEILPLCISRASCISEDQGFSLDVNIKSLLSIELATFSGISFAKLKPKKLRFFVQPLNNIEYLIYKNILHNVVISAIKADQGNLILLDKGSIKKVGFTEEENIFPYEPNSFLGYRLMTEFFVCPEKFLFFDLDLKDVDLSSCTSKLTLQFYLSSQKLSGVITSSSFSLNTTIMVNLHNKESDPIELTEERDEYQIIIDQKKPKHYKAYSIDKVKVRIAGKEREAENLFQLNYKKFEKNSKLLWYFVKKSFGQKVTKESLASLVLVGNYDSSNKGLTNYLYIEAKCFNGDLPHRLSQNSSFALLDKTIPIDKVICLIKPSAVQTLGEDNMQKWNLLAHFSWHYLNIANSNNAKLLIQEMLSIYTSSYNKISQLLVSSITDVKISEQISRIQTSRYSQFCRGNLIVMYFDNSLISEGILYLFLCIFENFLSIYCSINSFIQLLAKSSKDDSVLYEGKPRTGMKNLI